jgi:hypothetical protein
MGHLENRARTYSIHMVHKNIFVFWQREEFREGVLVVAQMLA